MQNFENVGNFWFIHQQELLNFDSNETFNPSIILKRQKKKKSGTINNNTDPHINYNTRLTPSPSLCLINNRQRPRLSIPSSFALEFAIRFACMQLLFHPRGSGVEWSGEKVARIWNIVIWNWKASWKNSLFTCSRTYPLFTQESTTFVTTRSARRLVNWSSLRPLHLARSLNAAAAANSLRARQIPRDKYQWWFEIVESTRREYVFDSVHPSRDLPRTILERYSN